MNDKSLAALSLAILLAGNPEVLLAQSTTPIPPVLLAVGDIADWAWCCQDCKTGRIQARSSTGAW